MSEFKIFSFSNVNVIFGILELQGFADGDDVVSVSLEADQFNDLAGAKGDVVRSQTNDNRVTVTVKLLQNSGSNLELNALYNVDRATGVGVAPMIIQDKETGEAFSITNCWINKYPDVNRGQGVNSMDWVFRGSDFIPIIT
jgi:hypothetical protein